MRGVLEAKKLRGVRSEEGNAEGVGKLVKDGWADAVIIAQVGSQQCFLLFISRVSKFPGVWKRDSLGC